MTDDTRSPGGARPKDETQPAGGVPADRRRIDLASGPALRRLVAFAWPLFIGNMLTTMYNLADMFWVAFVGTDAVAAISITFPTVWLNVSLGLGVTIAGIAFVSQYTGAGKTEEAGRTAGQVLLLACAVAAAIAALGISARRPILALMGAEGAVMELGADYLAIVLAGLPFQYIYLTFRSVSQGTGDSKTPRNLLILTVLFNAAADPF